MPQLKKILITLSDSLLKQVDALSKKEGVSRSQLIRNAMQFYIKQKERTEIEKELKKGYLEMGELNLELAEICFDSDQQTLNRYEEKLAECE